MTKCRQNVHTRSGRQYPRWSREPARFCDQLLIDSARAEFDPIYGILNEPVSIRKLGTSRVPGVYRDEVVKRVPYSVKTGHKISKTGTKFSKSGTKVSKTGTKLSKTVNKPVELQSNGRVNLNNRYKPARDPKTWLVYTPLGSPTGS